MRLGAACLAALALTGCASFDFGGGGPEPAPAPPPAEAACPAPAARMARVELIFGATHHNGRAIPEARWRRFLADEVTPRFPDGLTVLSGSGQWKRPDTGDIARMPVRMLLIWYAPGGDADARIEAIRAAYKSAFDQLSVMRVDSADCVSF